MEGKVTEEWEPTKSGGLRRRQRVAQKMQIPAEAPENQRRRGHVDAVGPEGDAGVAGQSAGIHMPEVGGSNPSPLTNRKKARKWEVRWRERLGLPSCPYLIRTKLETPWFSIRLHEWHGDDDKRAYHEHPWNFAILCLRGHYYDMQPDVRVDLVKAGQMRWRSKDHLHYVVPGRRGALTLMVTGPARDEWAFYIKERFGGVGKRLRHNKYFYEHGHQPCD